MVDMVKKLHKKNGDLLQPGEKLRGAATITAVGQFKKNVAFGAVGGLVGAAVGQAIKGKGIEAEEGTMADSFPDIKQAILAVSDQRWILFEQSMMSGAAKAILAEWPHTGIDRLDIEPGKLTSKLDIVFADGSVTQVEAVRAAKPQDLVEAARSLR